jgi:hypothetical protein
MKIKVRINIEVLICLQWRGGGLGKISGRTPKHRNKVAGAANGCEECNLASVLIPVLGGVTLALYSIHID